MDICPVHITHKRIHNTLQSVATSFEHSLLHFDLMYQYNINIISLIINPTPQLQGKIYILLCLS